MKVLWEMGIDPDVRMLPDLWRTAPLPTREAAFNTALTNARGHQLAFWPFKPELAERARQLVETRFDELFAQTSEGYQPRWQGTAREVLITWEPRR